jgi:hypothetical protein
VRNRIGKPLVLKACAVFFTTAIFPLSASNQTTFLESFDNPPDYGNHWAVAGQTGASTVTYTQGTFRIQAPPVCTGPSTVTGPGTGITYRSKQAFVGDLDVSFQLNHGGFGRTTVGLWSATSNQLVIQSILDTDDTAYLSFGSGANATEYTYSSAPYMNKWITLRIQIVGGQVNFFADDGTGSQLLKTWPVPVTTFPDAYYLAFGAGSVCWKSGANDTSFRRVTVTGTPSLPYSYTSFQGQTYSLNAWPGADLAVLTSAADLDPVTMARIGSALDAAWNVYFQLIGKPPTPLTSTTFLGKGTIAEVPLGATCGAACSYLGYTGTEIAAPYFDVLYNGVKNSGQYDQVLFYELGRNFWFYQKQLGSIDAFVTGFAIANRFVSMQQAGLQGGPFNGTPFATFQQQATTDLIAAYLANPSLNWRNTIGAGQGVPGQIYNGSADLAGAMFYKIYSDHGYSKYQDFFKALALQPTATTPAGAIQNFETAALQATGEDYGFLFDPSTVGTFANFETLDTTTQGNWPGHYGQDGYIIANGASNVPVYATASFSGSNTWTWVASSTDPRALLKSATSTDRIASTYYAPDSFTIDLPLSRGPHRVALYLLDLDTSERSETVSILDPNNNAVLNTQSFAGLHNGKYAVWTLQGHVLVRVTRTGGINAVLSGLFFDTPSIVNPPLVSVTSPSAGTVTGSVTLTASVQTTIGVQAVQFLLDANPFGSPVTSGVAGNYSIQWATATSSNGPHTVAATALDTQGQSTTSAPVTVTVSNPTLPPSTAVVFVRTDTTTQGSWKSTYGIDGEMIANDSSHLPSYATVGLGNALQWTWSASTADQRAPAKYGSSTDRIASTFYNSPGFTIDVNPTDNQPHQVALYLLDWDSAGRTQTVSILDPNTHAVLDTRTAQNFYAGEYLVWNIQGHVLVQVQLLSGINAVVSGIFFSTAGTSTAPAPTVSITSPVPNALLGGTTMLVATASSTVGISSVKFVLDGNVNLGTAIADGSSYSFQWSAISAPNGMHTLTAIATDTLSQQTTSAPISITVGSPTVDGSAVFVARDTATGGSWKTRYGGDGEVIANDSTNPPGYAVLSVNAAANWTWAANISDARALQTAAGNSRIASTFYAANSFSMDLHLTDTLTHQLALYFLDWDDGGRAETVMILNANTQAVLDTQSIANFKNGAYLVWNITGHVTVVFNRTAGQNAVVSGVFLAP